MAFTQFDIFQDAAIALSDESYRRWTPQKLNRHLNAAIRTLVEIKPSASVGNVTFSLAAGVEQELPEAYVALVRVLGNCNADGYVLSPAPAVDLNALEAIMPGWADATVEPHTSTVKNVILDEEEPRDFMVYPGNDGTGRLRLTVSTVPASLADGATVGTASTYTATVPLSDIYRQPVTHLTIHYALAPDLALRGNGERAMMHLNAAREALGLKRLHESTMSPRDAYKAENNA